MASTQTSQPNIPPQGRTDVLFPEVKLYIEGVQLPFINMSISSGIGMLPTASVSVPPQVGMMEITRHYNPKVHIFFTDPIDGVEKVLFSGIVCSSSYDKTSEGSGGSSITFDCCHRYQTMTDFLVDFSGWTGDLTDPQAEGGVVKSPAVSSEHAMALAMTGIIRDPKLQGAYIEVSKENVQNDALADVSFVSPFILPASLAAFKNRIIGMPAILLNLWNQFKHFAFRDLRDNEIMEKLYVPLIEDGLQFFKRLTGHFHIEDLLEEDRINPCPETNNPEAHNKPRIIAPGMRIFLRSAAQAELSTKLTQSVLQFSGELEDILGMYSRFMLTLDYEILYLTSPVEIPKDPSLDENGNFKSPGISADPLSQPVDTYAADVIVKPQLPFYYAPVCNVLYPSMITRVSLNQDDYNIPTRINVRNKELPGVTGGPNSNFRAPASIREAIASIAGKGTKTIITASTTTTITTDNTQVKPGTRTETEAQTTAPGSTVEDVPNANLQASLGPSYNKVGKFEQGRGIKYRKMLMPNWLAYYSASQFKDTKASDGWPDPEQDPDNFNALEVLSQGWAERYGNQNAALNPWDKSSGLKGYQRLLIAAADYQYSMTVARARAGTVSCVFNPYIIPGYPMDILDATPNHPSFHAYCTSVTHTITHSSISTQVSFVAATTYTELANYYMPPVHPWLQNSLSLARQQTLINNDDAKLTADRFYVGALGVKCATPSDLYNFDTGGTLPVDREPGGGLIAGVPDSIKDANGGERNPNFSTTGNLFLTYRPIENKAQVEERWRIKFVDLVAGNYNTDAIKFTNKVLLDKQALEPGESQWLSYDPIFFDDDQT